ncbi:MAG: hypothetical protein AAFX50_07960, partial [Acidobacteriota bacterium]
MRRLLLPLIPLAAALFVHFSTDCRWLTSEALPAVQRVAVGAVVLLAWRLRRGRIAWAALALGGAAEAAPRGEAVALLATVWLLADLAAAASLKEWWFLSRPGAMRLAVLGAQAGSVVGLLHAAPAAGAALVAVVDGWPATWPAPKRSKKRRSPPTKPPKRAASRNKKRPPQSASPSSATPAHWRSSATRPSRPPRSPPRR